MKIIFSAILLMSSTIVLVSCDNAKFASRTSPQIKPQQGPEAGGTAEMLKTFTSKPTPIIEKADQKIWVVSTAGVATLLTLNGDKISSKKTWTGVAGSGGTRTYLTEGGLIAARFPYLYFIDPESTPEGALVGDSIKNVGASGRICITSYKKNGNRFVFGAWGDGKYFEIPLGKEKPYRPLWSEIKNGSITTGTGNWGYSCFIDQKRKIFYSQWGTSGVSRAINLETLTGVDPVATAPNARFVSTNLANIAKGVYGGSYSMSGDSDGNVFSGTSVYTMAHDKDSDSVWVTMRSQQNNIGVFPRECFVSKASCTGYAWYNSPDPAYIGPLSALSDGRIAGFTRGTANVYVLSLKNKSDRTAGINAVKVETIAGDPYMYTDFTGATLYVSDFDGTVKMSEVEGFEKGKKIEKSEFHWVAKPNAASKDWAHTKLEVRCYAEANASAKPEFEEVKSVSASGVSTPITASSCKGVSFDFMDVKLTQLGGNSHLEDLESFHVSVGQ